MPNSADIMSPPSGFMNKIDLHLSVRFVCVRPLQNGRVFIAQAPPSNMCVPYITVSLYIYGVLAICLSLPGTFIATIPEYLQTNAKKHHIYSAYQVV